MLIGIVGRMGAGKTLSMSILATYIHVKMNVPVWANYTLKKSHRLKSMKELWGLRGGTIVAFDELHMNMDSRVWKNNVLATHFITQTRKKNMVFMYTTQHIRQVDIRVRLNTDVVIYVENTKKGMSITFVDYQYGIIGKKFYIRSPKNYYKLYNTLEVVLPLRYTDN